MSLTDKAKGFITLAFAAGCIFGGSIMYLSSPSDTARIYRLNERYIVRTIQDSHQSAIYISGSSSSPSNLISLTLYLKSITNDTQRTEERLKIEKLFH